MHRVNIDSSREVCMDGFLYKKVTLFLTERKHDGFHDFIYINFDEILNPKSGITIYRMTYVD